MIFLFVAVLAFAFATGLYDWPFLPPVMAYVVFWIMHMKLMSEEEARLFKAIPGVQLGRFVGRGVWVALAWGVGALARSYGFVPA